MSTHPTVITGTNNGNYQVSKDAWNAAHLKSTLPFVTVGSDAGCDYVTDGTADQTQFNTAIAALTSGGSIFAKRATYNLTGSIVGSTLDNIHLLFEYGSQLVLGANMDLPAISLASCDNWLIENAPIDGQIATQTDASGNGGIGMVEYGILINVGCNNVILNPQIKDCGQVGVVIAGTGDYLTDNNKVLGGKITGCGWNGLTADSIDHAHPLYVTNTVVESVEVSHVGDVGLSTYGAFSKFRNNYIHDLDGALGFNNAQYGIAFETGNYGSKAKGNTVRNCVRGITDLVTSENKIVDNDVSLCSVAGIVLANCMYDEVVNNRVFQNAGNGIIDDADCSKNYFIKNKVWDNSFGNAGNYGNGIKILGDVSLVDGNICYDTRVAGARTQTLGIEVAAGATSNIIVNNIIFNNYGGHLTDGGTTTIKHNNMLDGTWTA